MDQEIGAFQATALAEATCYSLPYGGIGFASHMITYYTMAMLFAGRQPLPPFRPLKQWKWDLLLGGAQLLSTIIISVITMARCKHQWAFLVLAAWMLTTSFCLSILTISAPSVFSRGAASREFEDENQKRSSFGWLVVIGIGVLWVCGCVAGLVAIVKITIPQFRANQGLQIETGVLAALVFLALVTLFVDFCVYLSTGKLHTILFVIVPVTICFFALIWMDWTLGLVTGNLVGQPAASARVLYWTYVAFKRLPLAAM